MEFNLAEKGPLQFFSKDLVRIKYIQHIQNDLKEMDVKKLNHKIYYLNQSYILHLVAYWQSFIEGLVEHGVRELMKLDKSSPLNDVMNNNLATNLKAFNTPNAQNIDRLFKAVLAIEKVTSCWEWEGVTRNKAIEKVKEILSSRHQIAHTGQSEKDLEYHANFEDMNYLHNLAAALDFTITAYIRKAKGEVDNEIFNPPNN